MHVLFLSFFLCIVKKKRARLGSGELLLQESSDGLIMSPALHRRRLLQALPPSEGIRSTRGHSLPLLSASPNSNLRVSRPSAGAHVGVISGSGLGDERGSVSRHRSSTWDEHEVMAQLERKESSRTGDGVGEKGAGSGRQRTWSHHGAVGHGQEARPSAEWEHLDAFQVCLRRRRMCVCMCVCVPAYV